MQVRYKKEEKVPILPVVRSPFHFEKASVVGTDARSVTEYNFLSHEEKIE